MFHVIRKGNYLIVDKKKRSDVVVPPRPSPDYTWSGEIWELANNEDTLESLRAKKLEEINEAFEDALAQGVTVSINHQGDNNYTLRMDGFSEDGIMMKMGHDLAELNNEPNMDIVDWYDVPHQNIQRGQAQKIFQAQGNYYRFQWKKRAKLRIQIANAPNVTVLQNISW